MQEEISQEELAEMSDEEILSEIGNRVYKAAIFFERLENAGRVQGNGHHIAQGLAVYAQKVYRDRKRR